MSLFEGSRIVGVTRYGEGAPLPAGTAMLTRFELAGAPFAALNGGPYFKLTEAASLVVMCETQEELDQLWDALSGQGGEAGRCGWLRDRFGLSWQVLPSCLEEMMGGEPRRVGQMMGALMGMNKLDIAALRAAFDAN